MNKLIPSILLSLLVSFNLSAQKSKKGFEYTGSKVRFSMLGKSRMFSEGVKSMDYTIYWNKKKNIVSVNAGSKDLWYEIQLSQVDTIHGHVTHLGSLKNSDKGASPEEKEKFYPIQHLDLTDISMPANIFDLFFSAHVLEHVPDIRQSLKEVYRTLAPGGVLTSTFPFRADRAETVIRAQLKDGRLVHLLEPQYHGNPVNVGEGSLVFQDIGWDILDACAAAGFANPRMAVLASSRYGVVQGGSIGIMALVAQKPIDGDDLPPYPEVFYEGSYF